MDEKRILQEVQSVWTLRDDRTPQDDFNEDTQQHSWLVIKTVLQVP